MRPAGKHQSRTAQNHGAGGLPHFPSVVTECHRTGSFQINVEASSREDRQRQHQCDHACGIDGRVDRPAHHREDKSWQGRIVSTDKHGNQEFVEGQRERENGGADNGGPQDGYRHAPECLGGGRAQITRCFLQAVVE